MSTQTMSEQIKLRRTASPRVSSTVFPNSPIPKSRIYKRLQNIKNILEHRNIKESLGWLYTLPSPFAVHTYAYFLQQNHNHSGTWSSSKIKPYATQQLEREVIHKMADLYHVSSSSLDGYITSGGTEANLFSGWIGRKYLEQHVAVGKICIVCTSLTHYSMSKIADILGVPFFITPLSSKDWNISQPGLRYTTETLMKKGFRGFILPLTVGYTSTGTADDLYATSLTVNEIEKETKAHFFVWIDAALSGLVIPFVDPDFKPFANSHIQTIVTDFHKFGLVPYPGGIVLYRNDLRKLIEKPIPYLPISDTTLLGSRPGSPAVSIWSMIHVLGKSGYKDLVEEQLALKSMFITKLQAILPTAEIITNYPSVSCGVIFRSFKQCKLPLALERRYGLFAKPTVISMENLKKRNVTIYKFFFLPHVKKKAIESFLNDLSRLCV